MAMSNFLILFLLVVGQVHHSYQIWPFTSWKPSLSGLFSSFSPDDLSALPSNSEIELIAPLPPGIFPEQPPFDESIIGDQAHFSPPSQPPIPIPSGQVPRQDAYGSYPDNVYGGQGAYYTGNGGPGEHHQIDFTEQQPKRSFISRLRPQPPTPQIQLQKALQFVQQQAPQPQPQRFGYSGEQPQFLIIQKPAPEAPENGPNNMVTRSSAPPQSNNQGQQPSLGGGNWVYLSPLDKLNSPEQPIILETYVDNQQYGTKGTKTSKQNQQKSGGLKLPQILSWSLFRKQQQQQQENQRPIIQYSPASYGVGSGNVNPATKPIYIYRAGNPGGNPSPISGNYQYISPPVIPSQQPKPQPQPQPQPQQYVSPPTKTVNSGGSSSGLSSQSWASEGQSNINPSSIQVWIENTPQPQPVGGTQQNVAQSGSGQISSWSSQNLGSVGSQQYWTESQSPSRVQFPKQDYQVIRTIISPSSSSSVSQVEPNQDLGGWDSIPLPDIIKPSAAQSESLEEQISSMVANVTASNAESQSQQQQQQQQESTGGQITHRIVYQALPTSSSPSATHGNATSATSGRSPLYSQQYTPIYQLLQPLNSDPMVPPATSANSNQQSTNNANNYAQN